ncbi:hypothetical protein [Scytonema sp. PCC 10023]|uniref:hypothetical protein n=1 Tax=Scytonema sp. PCC 10023 TaxID=1680591 RepID=UPI0039C64744
MYGKTITALGSRAAAWVLTSEEINGENREMRRKTQTGFGSGYSAMSIPNGAAANETGSPHHTACGWWWVLHLLTLPQIP